MGASEPLSGQPRSDSPLPSSSLSFLVLSLSSLSLSFSLTFFLSLATREPSRCRRPVCFHLSQPKRVPPQQRQQRPLSRRPAFIRSYATSSASTTRSLSMLLPRFRKTMGEAWFSTPLAGEQLILRPMNEMCVSCCWRIVRPRHACSSPVLTCWLSPASHSQTISIISLCIFFVFGFVFWHLPVA